MVPACAWFALILRSSGANTSRLCIQSLDPGFATTSGSCRASPSSARSCCTNLHSLMHRQCCKVFLHNLTHFADTHTKYLTRWCIVHLCLRQIGPNKEQNNAENKLVQILGGSWTFANRLRLYRQGGGFYNARAEEGVTWVEGLFGSSDVFEQQTSQMSAICNQLSTPKSHNHDC